MSTYLSQALIQTTDTDQAVAFYRDALGMTVLNDVANGDHHWVTLGSDGAATQIVLNPVDGLGLPEADLQALKTLLAKGSLGMFIFATDDLEATVAQAKQAGADVIQDVTQQPWGVKDAALRDPSGNVIRLNQA